jgi:hypothetical protein
MYIYYRITHTHTEAQHIRRKREALPGCSGFAPPPFPLSPSLSHATSHLALAKSLSNGHSNAPLQCHPGTVSHTGTVSFTVPFSHPSILQTYQEGQILAAGADGYQPSGSSRWFVNSQICFGSRKLLREKSPSSRPMLDRPGPPQTVLGNCATAPPLLG